MNILLDSVINEKMFEVENVQRLIQTEDKLGSAYHIILRCYTSFNYRRVKPAVDEDEACLFLANERILT